MLKIKEAAQKWEAAAIEESKLDSRVRELGLCPVCMVRPPCLCDCKMAIAEMREFYEKNRRQEPKLIGSWGVDMDGLMIGLFDIATRKYREKF